MASLLSLRPKPTSFRPLIPLGTVSTQAAVNISMPSLAPSTTPVPDTVAEDTIEDHSIQQHVVVPSSSTTGTIEEPVESKDAWKRTTADVTGVDRMIRNLTSLLNKLTVDKFDEICAKIVELVKKECKDLELLKQIVHVVYEKAVLGVGFGDMYPKLCEVISQEINAFDRENPFSPGSFEKVSFKKVLLEHCQNDFEKHLVVAFELDDAFSEVESVVEDESSLTENRTKQKERILDSMKFLGQLYVRGMLPSKTIALCIFKLLQDSETVSSTNLECLCNLLAVCGQKLESDPELKFATKSKTNPTKFWFSQLQSISTTPDLPTRIRFLIIDLIDLRNNGWKPRRPVEKAQKLEDIHSAQVGDSKSSGRFTTVQIESKQKKPKSLVRAVRKGDRYSNISKVTRVTDRIEWIPKSTSAQYENEEIDNSGGYNYDDTAIPDDVRSSIKFLVEEFTQSKDFAEALRSLEEVSIDRVDRNITLVYEALCLAVELTVKDSRNLLSELLSKLFAQKHISQQDLTYGLAEVFNIISDLKFDFPNAFTNLTETLQLLISSSKGLLNGAFVHHAANSSSGSDPEDVVRVTNAF
jgi:hypothetical protein